MSKIRVAHSESGCWQVLRGDYVIDIYPPEMWRYAYKSALLEAIYQNLSIVRLEICS